jgi:ubiquinol-cytochrome c reductase cytochrome c1 subunit
MRKLTTFVASVALVAAFAASAAQAQQSSPETEEFKLPSPGWSFDGPFGTFDPAARQRGFQVYKEVCSACHSMNLMHYRNLEDIGFSEAQVKAIAASVQVQDGPNDNGDMFERPGRPYDTFKPPFANDQAARAANNGALPPDLSLIVKAREGGPDYVYGILTGFADAPAGMKMMDGMNYNKYFPGHQIAMPPPLTDDRVTYADGTKATIAQEAHDVVTFLTWASEPSMEMRKRVGMKVIIFLLVLSGLLFAVKRKVWRDVH